MEVGEEATERKNVGHQSGVDQLFMFCMQLWSKLTFSRKTRIYLRMDETGCHHFLRPQNKGLQSGTSFIK